MWLRACDNYGLSTLINWWKRWSRTKFASKLCLRDQQNKWMQDGCKVYMESYMALNGSCFMVTCTIFKTTSWRSALHKTGRPWHFECSHAWGPAWINIHQNNIWLRALSHMTSYYTWRDTAWFWRCFGPTFGHFLLGCHNFMVMCQPKTHTLEFVLVQVGFRG